MSLYSSVFLLLCDLLTYVCICISKFYLVSVTITVRRRGEALSLRRPLGAEMLHQRYIVQRHVFISKRPGTL